MTQIDWDDRFANMAHVPGSEALPEQWAAAAEAFRSSGVDWESLPYGASPRAAMDIFRPAGTARGLMLFVHGGYWMKFDRSYWSHLARGALARGWAVAMPSYTLAPEARIAAITGEIAQAVSAAAQAVPGPIRLAGHSAGGHLVSRLICDDSALPSEVLARIEKTVSISGLHDLRPLLNTQLNDTLRLDAAEAHAESPALHVPRENARLTAWVGGAERPEFIRQAQLLELMWSGFGVQVDCVVEPGHNHFTVIEALQEPASALTASIFEE